MYGELILLGALSLPLVLGLAFRVSTSHIFFSLMAGELLGRYFGHDLDKQAEPVLEQSNMAGLGEIILIVLPMILTVIFLRRTLNKGRVFLHIIPLLITGVVCAAFVLPVLPENLQGYVRDVPLGSWLLELNRAIIGTMVALQLVALWLLTKREKTEKKI